MARYNTRAGQKGNMILLTSLTMGFASLLTLIAISFGSLFWLNGKTQTFANQLALAGACRINEYDRVGRMNSMIACCRQLVYSSRMDYDQANTNYPHLTGLAQDLLNEAHEGALLLETDRTQLRNLITSEVSQTIQAKFNAEKDSYKLTMPCLKVGVPELLTRNLGQVDNIKSNVEEMKGFDELEDHDQTQYIDSQSKLYKENINARLPGSDSHLNFRISCLAAPVDDTVAPARVVLRDVFEYTPDGHLASAVWVELATDVETGLGPKGNGRMHLVGAATAAGGSPMP